MIVSANKLKRERRAARALKLLGKRKGNAYKVTISGRSSLLLVYTDEGGGWYLCATLDGAHRRSYINFNLATEIELEVDSSKVDEDENSSDPIRRAVFKNLKLLGQAANKYLLENGKLEVKAS